MISNLRDALSAARIKRGVLSKQIVWESGVSKSQFYRIIKGVESPSSETKNNISKSLQISVDEFDILHRRSLPTLDAQGRIQVRQRLSPSILVLVFSLCVLFISGLMLIYPQKSIDLAATKTIFNLEDDTLFIEDVTIPDGSSIPVNTRFEKIWRVKNIGKVVWEDRYLKRMTPASDLICSSPMMVPIPETLPGQEVDISVVFETPYLPGSCRTDWKSSDKNGNLHFPEMHGLFSIVVVVND